MIGTSEINTAGMTPRIAPIRIALERARLLRRFTANRVRIKIRKPTAGAANKTSSVEIWWRRPGCVKMLWSNGNINTSNMEMN